MTTLLILTLGLIWGVYAVGFFTAFYIAWTAPEGLGGKLFTSLIFAVIWPFAFIHIVLMQMAERANQQGDVMIAIKRRP